LQVPISPPDQDAFLHLWRYIGYLLGIRDEFNPCTSREIAKEFLQAFYRTVPRYQPTQASVLLVWLA
jgi:hypothetical protein